MSADIQRAMRVLLFCEKMWSVKIIRYEYNLKFGHDSQLVRALVSLSQPFYNLHVPTSSIVDSRHFVQLFPLLP